MIKNIYIRVDANKTIGSGHLIRTHILAKELRKKNINIEFICETIPFDYENKLLKEGYKIHKKKPAEKELNKIIDIISSPLDSLLITDSDKETFYTKDFQTIIRSHGIKLMMITFFHQPYFYADIILNQNIMALSQTYKCEPYTKKLLGLQYVILNEEYRLLANNINLNKNNALKKTVLITFGSADVPDRTSFVLRALQPLQSGLHKIIVILGALYSQKNKVEELAKAFNIPVEIYQNTPKMPHLLAEANVSITSGGLTVWEAGALHTLNVVMGYSYREKEGGKYYGDNNIAIYLGTKEDYTVEKLSEKLNTILKSDYSEIIKNLAKKINPFGVEKVVNELMKL